MFSKASLGVSFIAGILVAIPMGDATAGSTVPVDNHQQINHESRQFGRR